VISIAISTSTSFLTTATSTTVPSLFPAYTALHIWSNGSGIYGKRVAGRNATSLKKARSILPSSSSSLVEVVDAPQPVRTPSVDVGRRIPANATRGEVEYFTDSLEDAPTAIHLTWNITIAVEEFFASGSEDTSAQPSSPADPSFEIPALAEYSTDTTLQQDYTSSVDTAMYSTDLTENASIAHDVPQGRLIPLLK